MHGGSLRASAVFSRLCWRHAGQRRTRHHPRPCRRSRVSDTLTTTRLRLDPLAQADGDLYASLYSDFEVMRHVRSPLTRAEARRSFAVALRQQQQSPARHRWWTLRSREHAEPFGLIGLAYRNREAELGILLHPGWQGRGLATEAVHRLCTFAVETQGLSMLSARHRGANLAAARLFAAAGFEPSPGQAPGECCWRRTGAGNAPSPETRGHSGPLSNPLP